MRWIILDRDGTINQDRDDFVKSAAEWIPLPGAIEAIAALTRARWRVLVVTNQSGIGRGLFDIATLNEMHEKMYRMVAAAGGSIEGVWYCPHTPKDVCSCRKPLPGLFQDIQSRYQLDMRLVPTVGDSLRDLQAGAAAGCPTHLVLSGKEKTPLLERYPPSTIVHTNLWACVDYLLRQHEP